MVIHADRARRENRQIDAALIHLSQLIRFNAGPDFLIGHKRRRLIERQPGSLEVLDLPLSKPGDLRRRRREMAMNVDDH